MYDIALWLTPASPGAEFVDRLSESEIVSGCNVVGWAYGDRALCAIFALMHRFRLQRVYAGAVVVDGCIQWRYQVNL